MIRKYTADNEDPCCTRCDNCVTEYGCKRCGPEYGWANYIRTVTLEEVKND